MKLALIPPLQLLNECTGTQSVQLMLPQLLRDPGYAARYSTLCDDPTQFVIMDNGAAEDNPFDAEQILIIANTFRPEEVVASDIPEDAAATKEATKKFIDLAINSGYDRRLAVVAQGKNIHEAYDLACELIEECKMVTAVHIPRLHVRPEARHARLDLAGMIHSTFPYIDIHLLGASMWWPQEILEAATNYPFIRSMDTSMPFVYAVQEFYVDANIAVPPRMGNMDYFTSGLTYKQRGIAMYNVKRMQYWADGVE